MGSIKLAWSISSPPARHPGNFDFKPSDVQTLANAKLFLLHGWPGEGYTDKFIAAANNPNLTVIKASVDGNWMIPSVQLTAADRVASILSQADGQNTAAYQLTYSMKRVFFSRQYWCPFRMDRALFSYLFNAPSGALIVLTSSVIFLSRLPSRLKEK